MEQCNVGLYREWKDSMLNKVASDHSDVYLLMSVRKILGTVSTLFVSRCGIACLSSDIKIAEFPSE
jgi:hypothetical protein